MQAAASPAAVREVERTLSNMVLPAPRTIVEDMRGLAPRMWRVRGYEVGAIEG